MMFFRPAAVAIHDYGNMLGEVAQIQLWYHIKSCNGEINSIGLISSGGLPWKNIVYFIVFILNYSK
jgi:hypothetical protein